VKKIVFRNTLSDDKEYVHQFRKVHIFLFKYALVLIMIVILVSIAPAFATFAVAAPALSPIATHTLGDPQELEIFIDGIMASQLIDQNVAGAIVVIVSSGQVLLAKGYGYADVEKQISVDPERTLFRPGSVTKLFTWTAIMQLVEQGKIDLQADVNNYLTHFKIPATYQEPITMLDLMAHTAGFEERFKNLFKSSEAK
jgi:CubicO group peptidase (beta-lactamase class C family)